jgi:hypothetical protein
MRPVFVPEPIPSGPSIFLAGPTPRNPVDRTWRPEALRLLADFDGFVFCPETDAWGWHGNFGEQVEWEEAALKAATVIVFWVPRELLKMPGFTTNIEFGNWMGSGKVVFGAPPRAPKTGYMRYYCEKLGIPQADTLKDTLGLARGSVDALLA